jgi:hypothetical protein
VEAVTKKALGDADYADALGGASGLMVLIDAQAFLERFANEQYQGEVSRMPNSLQLAILEVTARRFNFDNISTLKSGFHNSLASQVVGTFTREEGLLRYPNERSEAGNDFYAIFGKHMLPLMDRYAQETLLSENEDNIRSQWQVISLILRASSLGSTLGRIEGQSIETMPTPEASAAMIDITKLYISITNQCYLDDTSFSLWALCGRFFADEENVRRVEGLTLGGLSHLLERAKTEGYINFESDLQDVLGHLFYAIARRKDDDQSDFLITRGLNVHNWAVLEFKRYSLRQTLRTIESVMQGFSFAARQNISIACRYQWQREGITNLVESDSNLILNSFSPAEAAKFASSREAYLQAEKLVFC